MTELQVDFELLPRETLEAEMSLEPRSEIDATFEINIATKGDKGDKGDTGPAGKDATINGQNTITLNGSNGIIVIQNGTTTTISAKTLEDLINGLATVARTGSYTDLINQPTIGNAILTIQRNGVSAGTFTANATKNQNINIQVPTTASEVGALPNTTTINDLTTQAQQNALNSGITSTLVGQITTNKNNITNEVTDRQNADNDLQQQIDAISASSDVTDIVGTHAELEAYDTSKLKDNDIIKVLQDETEDNATTYYRWSTHTDTFTLIGEEGPYYTKSQADDEFVPQTRTVNGKALSSNISLSAGDVGALPDSTVIPTVNDATLTIQKNGTAVATFTANSSTNKTANITVPTDTGDLTNNAGFITSAALAGYATETWVTNQGYLTGITSLMVTTALSYTPENVSNKVTSLSSSSDDTQYPSAKCVWDIVGDVEATLNTIRGV